jgi:CDP-glucose 4,6-dehydratase
LKPYKIVCLIRSKDPSSYFYINKLDEKVVCAYGDLNDKERILNVVTKYEIDYVFHIGAQAIVPTAVINPYEVISTNVMGTVNILEAVKMSSRVKALVVASSDKAYGKDCTDAVEDNSMAGDHPYDVSKSCADLISLAYHNTYNLPITISRFGNIYGPGDLNMNRIIPGIMKSILNHETLELRSDGTFVRDYVYVKDVVDGYIQLAEQIDLSKGEAFNFSSGYNFSVLDLIEKIGAVLQEKIDYKIVNNQKNEILAQSLNYSKAEKVLNWKAKSSFEDSIKETFRWYSNY